MIKFEVIKKVVEVHKIEITGRKLRLYTDKECTQKNLVEFIAYAKDKTVHNIDVPKLVRALVQYYDMIKNKDMELLQAMGVNGRSANVSYEQVKDVYPSITKFIYFLEQQLFCVFIQTKVPKGFTSSPQVNFIDLDHIYLEDGGATLYVGKLSKKATKTSLTIDFNLEATGVSLRLKAEDEDPSHIHVMHMTLPKHLSGVSVIDLVYIEEFSKNYGLDIKREGI